MLMRVSHMYCSSYFRSDREDVCMGINFMMEINLCGNQELVHWKPENISVVWLVLSSGFFYFPSYSCMVMLMLEMLMPKNTWYCCLPYRRNLDRHSRACEIEIWRKTVHLCICILAKEDLVVCVYLTLSLMFSAMFCEVHLWIASSVHLKIHNLGSI